MPRLQRKTARPARWLQRPRLGEMRNRGLRVMDRVNPQNEKEQQPLPGARLATLERNET